MLALLVSVAALALMMGGWMHYLWLIPQERVPEEPVAHSTAMAAATGLGVLGLVFTTVWGGGLPVLEVSLQVSAVLGAAGFFYLMGQAPLPDTTPRFAVGSVLPPFSALTHEGVAFDASELRGHRVLLKFFRGHW